MLVTYLWLARCRFLVGLCVILLALFGCSPDDSRLVGVPNGAQNVAHWGMDAGTPPASPRTAPEHEQKASIHAAYLAMRMKEAAREPEYAIALDPDGTHAARGQGGRLRGQFDTRGAALNPTSNGEQTRLDVAAIGCSNALEPVEPTLPAPSPTAANRLTYTRRAGKIQFSEEWTSGQPGLEQSFTVYERPCNGRELVIELAVMGLTPTLPEGTEGGEGGTVELRDSAGILRFRYSELYAYDAAGEVLPATMRVSGERIALHVATTNARWPVVVDPLVVVAEQELSSDFGGADDNTGYSVALSEDGKTALVGAPYRDLGSNANQGAVYVFVNQGTAWSWQTTLVARDGAAGDSFGYSVALSGDTAIIGAPGHQVDSNLSQGAAYIFVRSVSSWSAQLELTAGSAGAAYNYFGSSVAVSGGTAIVGAPYRDVGANSDQGAAYVFVRSGNGWLEPKELPYETGAAGDGFGDSVALSGNTALVGAPGRDVGANSDQGAAYVFVRSGSDWSQEKELTRSGRSLGTSVALNGNTALVGAPTTILSDWGYLGGVYVFVRSGSGWAEPQELFRGNGSDGATQRYPVALNDDTAIVGAPYRDVGSNSNQGAAYVFVRSGSGWAEPQVLTGSVGAADDNFGYSVALSGDTAIVGAPIHAVGSNSSKGIAHVFVRSVSGWAEQPVLTGSAGAAYDKFGYSLALSGDTAIVGAPTHAVGSNSSQGAAYVFVRSGSGWAEQQVLTGSVGAADDNFGYSVALSGDTAIVGAPSHKVDSKSSQGAAYVFVRSVSGWAELKELTAGSAGATGDYFGYSVALSGDTAIVGAPYRDVDSNSYQGAAYVFVRSGSGWAEPKELIAGSAGATGDNFGYSVALSGDTAIVGAPYHRVDSNSNQGAAYVFVRSGSVWSDPTVLTGSAGAPDDRFGYSVALSGDTAIVGAPCRDVGSSTAQGAAYVFVRSGSVWSDPTVLTGSAGAPDDRFGYSVALSGDTAIVGAPYRDVDSNSYQGAAYVFVRSGSEWFEQPSLLDTGGAANDRSGYSVALSDNSALVGMPGRTIGENAAQGAAHIFQISGLAEAHCRINNDCATSYTCVDDVCCTTACNGPCEVCSAARGATKDGTCTPKAAGSAGKQACPNNVLCDGKNGTCPPGCGTSDELCPRGTYCAWGACQTKKGEGGPCEGSNECTTDGGCVDRVCCNETCKGACEACSAALGTAANGICSPAASGTPGLPACGGDVLCDGVSRACPGKCTLDAHCATGQYCETKSGKCLMQKQIGERCGSPSECATRGGCVDDVCCNTQCTGLCQACSAAAKTTGKDGECGNAKAGTDPHNQCTNDSPTSCGQNGLCDGSGACAFFDSTVACGGPTCVGNESRPRTCVGPLDCSASAAGISCGAYRCNQNTGECLNGCTTHSDCVATSYCDSATARCIAKEKDGIACSTPAMCHSTYCEDGVCCDTKCDGTCVACSTQKKGKGNDGACENIASGLDPDDECAEQAALTCGTNGHCSGVGACAFWRVGTDCSTTAGTNSCVGNFATGRICIGPKECARSTAMVDCSPQRCVSGSCSDCAADQDCADPNASYCDPVGQCQPRKAQGKSCGTNSECLSKHCVDGVCCESDCSGQCQWCGHPSAKGTCLVVNDGNPRGNRQKCRGAGTPCGGTCDGTNPDECSFPGPAAICDRASCQADSLRSAKTCDGTGACKLGAVSDCGEYACDSLSLECKTSCNTSADCRLGALCDGSAWRGTCNAVGAQCVGAFDIQSANGTVQSCRGYACLSGACQQQCGVPSDCAPGYTCSENACVLSSTTAPPSSASPSAVPIEHAGQPGVTLNDQRSLEGGGCGCRAVGRQRRSTLPVLLLALMPLAWTRRRQLLRAHGGGRIPHFAQSPTQAFGSGSARYTGT